MQRKFMGLSALVAAAVLPFVPAAAQSITGTVTYEGKAPVMKAIAMDADPVCAKKHTEPVLSEMLVMGPGNTMGNIIVSVTKGLPAGKTYPAPKEPVVMNQEGCQYKPHVMAVMVGQPFKILNSDGLMHNVHALPKVNAPFNAAMPPTMKEKTETFAKEEATFTIKCDVHPWMQAYMKVLSHPFYAVTKADGKFTLAGLDPGTYEVEAWHERLPAQTQTVTITGKEAKAITFKFTAPAAK
jgi:plastocyanin